MNYTLFVWINQWALHYGWLDHLMVFVAQYAEYLFGALLVYIWFQKSRRENGRFNQRTVLYAVAAAALALFINQLVILVYYHPRPFVDHHVNQLIAHAADTSFPSDHATGAFALAFALLIRKSKWGGIALAGAVLTGISRVFVGVHYPADVLGGAVIALLANLAVYRWARVLEPVIRFVLFIYDKTAARIPLLNRACDQPR